MIQPSGTSTSDDSSCVDSGANSVRVGIVVTSTHHGNTLRVAEAMATVMRAELLTPEQVTADQLSDYDLVGFGSGIYFGRHNPSLRRLVTSSAQLPPSAFVFSTAGLPWLWRLFHWPLRHVLEKRGCCVIGEFSCRGWDTVGPLFLMGGINRHHPDDRDLQRATEFANRLSQQLSQ